MQWRPITIVAGERGPVVSIHWQKLGLTLLVAVTSLWLLVAGGAWLFVKYHQDFPGVRYVDLVWPNRWPQYRLSQGNHYIAEAGLLLPKGEIATALYKLRAGISKAPANPKGRILLANIYLANRRPDLARAVLLDGMPALQQDPVYLQATLSFLLELQEDAKLLEVATALLAADGPARVSSRTLIATYAAMAAYYRGNYDQAEDYIDRHHLRDTTDGNTLQARIDWERGFPALALLRLNEHLAQFPAHDSALTLLAGYYRELGRAREWESTLVARLASDPLAAAPRIAYLHLHQQRGDHPRVERETVSYLRQFQRDPAALLLLADFAANTGQPALARRVQQALAPSPESAGGAALMVAEAHIVAGEYQPALDLIAGYTRDYPEWTGQFAPVFNGLSAVALYGLGKKDEARLYLDHLLAQKNLRAENLVAVSNRLSALGAHDLALSALGRAVEADPLNQAALANLIRLELETGTLANLPAHLDRFIRTRRPSREILARAHALLGSDLHLLEPAQKELLASLRSALAARRP